MQMTLMALAGYVSPIDGVLVTAVAALSGNRVLLGAADGHIYVLSYQRNGVLRKACATRSFLDLLGHYTVPGYVAAVLGHKPTPVDMLVVDPDRHLIYALAGSFSLMVCHSLLACRLPHTPFVALAAHSRGIAAALCVSPVSSFRCG
jgi:hypothetical protein